MEEYYHLLLTIMSLLAIIVFFSLYFVKAGYGIFASKSWGILIPNKIGWVVMECPVFITMAILFAISPKETEPAALLLFFLFQLHYFQRSFIFPLLLKGNSKMPISIVVMGMFFNIINGIIQGGWLFYFSPVGMYSSLWFYTPQFWIGTLLFFFGMWLNIDSDRRIRHLRIAGDTKHYLPFGGGYNFVTSANYLGELVEWCGFAIALGSYAGWVFVLWTFANLTPRANAIYNHYKQEFNVEITTRRLKRIIPFIY